MLNGMEQMFVNVLNGLGINVEELMQKANHLMKHVEVTLTSVDERLKRIEDKLGIIDPKDEIELELELERQIALRNDEQLREAMDDHAK